jgi:hypothetical protein
MILPNGLVGLPGLLKESGENGEPKLVYLVYLVYLVCLVGRTGNPTRGPKRPERRDLPHGRREAVQQQKEEDHPHGEPPKHETASTFSLLSCRTQHKHRQALPEKETHFLYPLTTGKPTSSVGRRIHITTYNPEALES